jgi:7-cyano-7-deazaguanine synthase
MDKPTLMVVSGGMDSVVCLHAHKNTIKAAVSFNYGSNHNNIELQYARYHCKLLNIPHTVIDLSTAMAEFKSALLNGAEAIPEGHYKDENIKQTVVPFRNGIMLSIAVGLAESKDLDQVMLASHAGDHAVYPDCREDFNQAFRDAAKRGTHKAIDVVMPFSSITKRDIATIGADLGIDWATTWSCYKGTTCADILDGEGDLLPLVDRPHHCGRCSTCVERIWALKDVLDDTIYDDGDYAINLLEERGEW